MGGKKDWTKRDFWSKTTLITGGVCQTWVNPPFRKLWKQKFILCPVVIWNFCFQSLILRYLTPFDWKFLWIGIIRAKDLWKNVAILQKWGFSHVPYTSPVIRVVLLLKSRFVQSFFSSTVYRYILINIFFSIPRSLLTSFIL